ncbi:MAG: GNAT family N-acetyltransferase [Firmicutes bacterium]|nr:GNAT family N-acetyltransferase [Bacillota bacterium]
MITPVLETERILLRPATVQDAEVIYTNWASDPEVAKYMRWSVHGSVGETFAWLATVEANMANDNYDWLFVLKETGQAIGSGGIFYNKTHGMYELGYCLMKKYWGQGLATEAAQAILKFGIDELNLTSFFACHAKENPASGRILERLGFVYKGDGTYSSFDDKRVFESREYFLRV